MKIQNHLLVKSFYIFCLLCIFFVCPAYSEDLPLELRRVDNTYFVENVGDCVIYKLEVYSIPPKKDGAASFFKRLGAEVVGVGSFSKVLGSIEKGGRLAFDRSDLINSDGKKLTDDYIIGALKFKGSTCGECGLSVMFHAR